MDHQRLTRAEVRRELQDAAGATYDTYSLPCIYRGEPTGQAEKCGCSGNVQPSYFCSSPQTGKTACLLRIGARATEDVKAKHGECSSCDHRHPPELAAHPKLAAKESAPGAVAMQTRPGDVYRRRQWEAMQAAQERDRLKRERGIVVVDCDGHGYGDAIVMAWIAEGSAGRCQLYATGRKRELLVALGQKCVDLHGQSQAPMVRDELRYGFAFPRLEFRAASLRIDVKPKRPTPVLSAESVSWAKELMAGGVLLLAPQSCHGNREWDVRHWVTVAEELSRQGVKFLFTGSEPKPELKDFPGNYETNLERMVAMFAAAKGVIGVDSFPINLSGTLDIPSVCLLSFTTPNVFAHTPSVKCLPGPIERITPEMVLSAWSDLHV